MTTIGSSPSSARLLGLSASPVFATTRWSIVAAAGGEHDEVARRDALGKLASTYWYPIYAFARRRGHTAADACDLTQGFFTRMLERRDMAGAVGARGRFRSYLLGCFKHFLSNENDRAQAAKRGGEGLCFSLDDQDAQERYRFEPTDDDDIEAAFERSWALALLEEVVGRLQDEHAGGAKRALFERLKPMLMGETNAKSLRTIADELDTTEGAVKVAAHRLRKRFAELLRQEIAHTLEGTATVEDEIHDLFQALSRRPKDPRA